MPSTLVTINGVRLEEAEQVRLQKQYGCRIPAGEYWYDKRCGAWGIQDGPTLGFTLPGINVGGPLRSDASKGDTGVFVNGRQLHRQDVIGLMQLGLPVQQGRYWVDQYGNCGYEGGPALLNLVQFAQSRQQGGGRNRQGWYTGGLTVGSDGQTTYFFDPSGSSAIR